MSQFECVLVQAFQAERERINLTTTELDGSEKRVHSDKSIRGSHLTQKSPKLTAAKPPPPLHIWSMPKSNPHIAFCTFMSTLRSHPLWLGRAIASIPSSLVSVGIEADAIAHAALRGICGFHSTEMNAWAARALLVIRGLDSNPLPSLLADHQTDGPTTTSPSVPAAVLRSFFAVAARPYIHLVLCGVIERISRERIRCALTRSHKRYKKRSLETKFNTKAAAQRCSALLPELSRLVQSILRSTALLHPAVERAISTIERVPRRRLTQTTAVISHDCADAGLGVWDFVLAELIPFAMTHPYTFDLCQLPLLPETVADLKIMAALLASVATGRAPPDTPEAAIKFVSQVRETFVLHLTVTRRRGDDTKHLSKQLCSSKPKDETSLPPMASKNALRALSKGLRAACTKSSDSPPKDVAKALRAVEAVLNLDRAESVGDDLSVCVTLSDLNQCQDSRMPPIRASQPLSLVKIVHVAVEHARRFGVVAENADRLLECLKESRKCGLRLALLSLVQDKKKLKSVTKDAICDARTLCETLDRASRATSDRIAKVDRLINMARQRAARACRQVRSLRFDCHIIRIIFTSSPLRGLMRKLQTLHKNGSRCKKSPAGEGILCEGCAATVERRVGAVNEFAEKVARSQLGDQTAFCKSLRRFVMDASSEYIFQRCQWAEQTLRRELTHLHQSRIRLKTAAYRSESPRFAAIAQALNRACDPSRVLTTRAQAALDAHTTLMMLSEAGFHVDTVVTGSTTLEKKDRIVASCHRSALYQRAFETTLLAHGVPDRFFSTLGVLSKIDNRAGLARLCGAAAAIHQHKGVDMRLWSGRVTIDSETDSD